MLFQFGNVRIDRNYAAVGGFSFADLNPTAVAAVLEVRFALGVVARESFLNPSVAASLGILDQAAVPVAVRTVSKLTPGTSTSAWDAKSSLITAIVYDEPVFGVVKRESPSDMLLDRLRRGRVRASRISFSAAFSASFALGYVAP